MGQVILDAPQVDITQARRDSRKNSIRKTTARFLNRDDAKFRFGSRVDYELTMLLLQEYIDTFGGVLLRAQEIWPTVSNTKKQTKVSDLYEPVVLERLLRGFKLFFVQYKVNFSSEELRQQTLQIVTEYIEWLVGKGYLEADFIVTYLSFDLKAELAAIEARRIIQCDITHRKNASHGWEDLHEGEPIYMVTRVRGGKVWLIYIGPHGYDELGPIFVPFGASDILKPGWCVECSIGLRKGRWLMYNVGKVLPV